MDPRNPACEWKLHLLVTACFEIRSLQKFHLHTLKTLQQNPCPLSTSVVFFYYNSILKKGKRSTSHSADANSHTSTLTQQICHSLRLTKTTRQYHSSTVANWSPFQRHLVWPRLRTAQWCQAQRSLLTRNTLRHCLSSMWPNPVSIPSAASLKLIQFPLRLSTSVIP